MFQVNLYTLLNKFNAVAEKEYKTYKENFMKRFEITEFPPYLILYIKVRLKFYSITPKVLNTNSFLQYTIYLFFLQRFTKNTFFVEKNPTIVNFPVKQVFSFTR